MTALPPDYDSDPGRWRSWASPRDVHESVAPELRGPVLDVGCGEGRLASLLSGVRWVGVDSSSAQLAANPHRPVVRADMRALPFRDEAFGEVEAERWDGKFFPLRTRDEVRAYCRHNLIPAERAEHADLPLWLTKRGVLVRAVSGPRCR